MIHRPHVDWFALAPANALLAVTGLALLTAVLVPRPARRTTAAALCALGYAVAFGFAVALYARSAHGHGVVANAFRRDRFAELAQMIVAGAGLLATGISLRERMRDFLTKRPELTAFIHNPGELGHGGRRLAAVLNERNLRRVLAT